MTAGGEQLKHDLIDQVLERIHQRFEAERAHLIERFVREFYALVPPDDLLEEDADDLYGRALATFSFAQKRKPGEARVRVYNPQFEEHGYRTSHTVVEVVHDDMPFLVDSVTAELGRNAPQVHLVIHPILEVDRDGEGRLVALHDPKVTADTASTATMRVEESTGETQTPARKTRRKTGAKTKAGACTASNAGDARGTNRVRESLMQIAISAQPSEKLAEIEAGLAKVLADVRAAVSDWKAICAKVRHVIADLRNAPPPLPRDEVDEAIALLEWIENDHFTFLGYREYVFEGSGTHAVARVLDEKGLGVLADPEYRIFDGLRNLGELPPEVRDFLREPALIRITKANRRATVHRRVHMDTIAVKTFDATGNVTGERLFAGLFTSFAYSRSPREIPLLRRKVAQVMARSGFRPDSHNGKALLHILETFPRDELFQISEDELKEIALGILHLQERQRLALFTRRDPFERFVSCLVFVPRDRYDTRLRLRLQDILAKAYGGEVNAFFTHVSEAALARVHIIVNTTPGRIPEVDKSALEQRLADAARAWVDHLQDALIEDRGEEPGLAATRRFARAFPASYQESFNAHTAVFDIARLEHAIDSGELAMNLYRPVEAGDDELRFKIYHRGKPVPLSDILPMLENMGLKVISEHPYEIHPEDLEEAVWIHDFEMRPAGGAPIELSEVREKFHEAFARVWRGEMENDGFNRLVLLASLTAREIIVLRAYCKYLRQVAIPFSQSYMEDTLSGNPVLARLLVQLFHVRFDPRLPGERDRQAEEVVAAIREGLEEVEVLDQDRIVRRFLNAIESTLRTNAFQGAAQGREKSYLSLKLDCEELEELPLPRPFREIFVYSPRVEAVHLRFGQVARGGLRWSDRREDFRTEVLGLVKAQQVKNAVIVPVGAKGGFVAKRLPGPGASRQELQDEGIACYQTFIRGMLDITDNRSGDEVLPPPEVVRHDGDDPYLVVAADKGTASFSDIANAISQEYGFWLDDAFASGGSAGYDHKAMGITARGAWESVKRHFRELGKDIQREDFTVVGCGDMGGDVFGNGMLLSKHIRLIGAFNHLHIFVDPEPDAAVSWKERKLLFEAGRGWDHYDSEKISKGGGVFERRAKSIKLTPEIRKAFAIEKESCTPNELIRALLQANVELIWFGGIGTYIKASDETHPEVGDRGNDGLRIDAAQVGAKVIGEGANLGTTQRGRIEYALAGGRCNTDAIDNSAGVDCSDHEVNIKILLGDIERSGDMTRKQRNLLLERMTDEVAELVLRDNYLQTQAISVTEHLGAHLLDRNARFMHALERQGRLNRAMEFLPDDETILERRKAGIGLTRPELAVLMSYAKIVLYEEILASGLPDDPYMKADLHAYFPRELQEAHGERIGQHRLRCEIISTVTTNSVINRGGLAFVHEVREKTGLSAEAICRAYTVSREVFGLRALWRDVEALDAKVPAETQYAILIECGRMMERATTWLLRNCAEPIDIAGAVDIYAEGVQALAGELHALLDETDRGELERNIKSYTDQGVTKDVARRTASLRLLPPCLDIVQIAGTLGLDVKNVARTYFAIGRRFGFDWLRAAAQQLPTDDAWDKLAVTAIIDDFYSYQGQLTRHVLKRADGAAGGGDGIIEAWASQRAALIGRTEQLLAELRSAGTPDLAMLAVANRQLKSMVGG